MFSFSQRSLENLKSVHPALINVANEALKVTTLDFGIIEGLRTTVRQHELFLIKKTQLDWPQPVGEPIGRHLTGHAFDFDAFVNGTVSWEDKYYVQLGGLFKQVASRLNIKISWGGDNPHWKDFDHIELDRVMYPDAIPPLVA